MAAIPIPYEQLTDVQRKELVETTRAFVAAFRDELVKVIDAPTVAALARALQAAEKEPPVSRYVVEFRPPKAGEQYWDGAALAKASVGWDTPAIVLVGEAPAE